MIDLILIAVLVVIIAAAGGYIYKAKKNGQKCIGCPAGCSCGTGGSEKKRSTCGCCGTAHKK